ncbi:MAG: glycosyltransferase family A protein [Candidatus Woesearchaeota archaeon]
MKPKVSVIVCTYNDGKYIEECIKSILNQSYKNFELLIIDDGSTDNTYKIVESFKDKRILYYKNIKNMGLAYSRSKGLKKSKGDFIFFTDADCIARKDWIEITLKNFKKSNIGIVEGKILAFNNKKLTISDKVPINTSGKKFTTGNIAYRKEYLKISGLSIKKEYEGFEDRELGLRVKKICDYIFEKKSIVYHQIRKQTFKSFLNSSKRIPAKVRLIKNYGDKEEVLLFILLPKYFFILFFPPLIFYPIIKGRVRSFYDLCFIPLIYIKAIYMRYLIWKTAIKEGVFVI